MVRVDIRTSERDEQALNYLVGYGLGTPSEIQEFNLIFNSKLTPKIGMPAMSEERMIDNRLQVGHEWISKSTDINQNGLLFLPESLGIGKSERPSVRRSVVSVNTLMYQLFTP